MATDSLVQELRKITEFNREKDPSPEECQSHSKCPKDCPDRKMGVIHIGGFGAHLSEKGSSHDNSEVAEFFSDFGELPMHARRIARHKHNMLKIFMKTFETNVTPDEFIRVAKLYEFNIVSSRVTNGYLELIISW